MISSATLTRITTDPIYIELKKKFMRRPGIKPGSRPWQGRILSLFIRSKPNALWVPLVNHSNLSDRMAQRRRHFIQISALSVFDGTVLAYRGIDG